MTGRTPWPELQRAKLAARRREVLADAIVEIRKRIERDTLTLELLEMELAEEAP